MAISEFTFADYESHLFTMQLAASTLASIVIAPLMVGACCGCKYAETPIAPLPLREDARVEGLKWETTTNFTGRLPQFRAGSFLDDQAYLVVDYADTDTPNAPRRSAIFRNRDDGSWEFSRLPWVFQALGRSTGSGPLRIGYRSGLLIEYPEATAARVEPSSATGAHDIQWELLKVRDRHFALVDRYADCCTPESAGRLSRLAIREKTELDPAWADSLILTSPPEDGKPPEPCPVVMQITWTGLHVMSAHDDRVYSLNCDDENVAGRTLSLRTTRGQWRYFANAENRGTFASPRAHANGVDVIYRTAWNTRPAKEEIRRYSLDGQIQTRVPLPSNVREIFSMADGSWLALSNSAVLRSENGADWTEVLAGFRATRTALRVGSGEVLVLTTDPGVYFSSENGRNWKNVTAKVFPPSGSGVSQ